ncbi:uncharacterized protein [Ptychodera flava]|uniref:uncharacterized protein n=1 Tax=Ptychodera flava TaxID=63121 RepID=UPI00396A8670
MEEGGMEPEKRSAQAVQQVPSQTSTIKPAAHSYACSFCSKKYKSVSGFRGHMKNVHEMRNVKVSQYRQPLEEDCSSSGSISKHTPGDGQTVSSDQITAVSHKRKQPGSFTRHMKYSNLEEKMLTYVTNACEGVGQDPNLAFEGSVFGNEIAAIGNVIAAKLKGDKFMDNCIMELLCQQLWKTAIAGESMKLFSSHMEEVWHTFFNFWVDEDITQQLSKYFKTLIDGKYDEKCIFLFTRMFLFKLMAIVKTGLCAFDGSQTTHTKGTHLTDEEKKALRYFAGYIPYKLKRRLKKKTTDCDYISVLHDMQEEESCGSSEDMSKSKEWLNKQDRGGLFHVTDLAFTFFVEVELICKHHLNTDNISRSSQYKNICQPVIDDVLSDTKVNSLWSSIARNAESDDVSASLVTMLVHLYVQVRCFSFSRNIVEVFKSKKKNAYQGF